MNRTWVALLESRPDGADRCSEVEILGGETRAAVLVCWTGRHSPHPRARSIDERAVGPGGPPMTVSWLDLHEDHRPLFDAPEVLEARRRLLLRWPSYGASSLMNDASRLAGSVVLGRPGERVDDPFARLGTSELLMTQGFFLPVPQPTGPALERYAGQPWPYDLFPT